MASNASVATEAIFTNPELRAKLVRSVSVVLLLMRHSP